MVSEELVTGQTTLGELMLKYPQLVEVLASYGIPSTGCSIPVSETVQGCAQRYVTEERRQQLLVELNAKAAQLETQKRKAGKKESTDGVTITDAVVTKVKDIIQKEHKEGFNLRVEVKPGGCAGMSYEFSLDDETKSDDQVIEKNGLRVVIDKTSMANLQGAHIDYVETLQRSGFRVDNPNAHAVCSCGQSFG